MIDAVFISDLHLHPHDQEILNRFNAFTQWAKGSVKKIYILGDFFHAWAGDDSLDSWSTSIAAQLFDLKQQGIDLFYMHGNRDFLLGKKFAHLAGWNILPDPSLIEIGGERVLLSHGDRYCTKDTGHQWLRLVTRNKIFSFLFVCLPLTIRQRLVNKVRHLSSSNYKKSLEVMDVVPEAVVKHMSFYGVRQLIHGHTHKPGCTLYNSNGSELTRYVLSDWDDTPTILCYDNTKGFYLSQIKI